MGCVFKRKGSKYFVAKYYPRPGGKPLFRSTKETREQLAWNRLEEFEREAREHPYDPPGSSKMKLGAYCRLPDPADPADKGGEYWQYLRTNRAATTLARAHDILRAQLIPAFGKFSLPAITPKAVEDFKQRRLEHVQAATVKKELNRLSNIFRVANKVHRYVRYNPVSDIEMPRLKQRKQEIPTPQQFKAFFKTAARMTPDTFPILLTLYQGGLRIDEARHLTPQDVDPELNRIKIRVKAGWHPKDYEDRDVPLVEPLRSVLLRQVARHSQDPWLFTRTDGKTLYCPRCCRRVTHIGRLRKTIMNIAKLAGIPYHVTHHLMRHGHSTHTEKLGATPFEVMAILGQQSTKVHGAYSHAQWSGMLEASARLGRTLGNDLGAVWVAVDGHAQKQRPATQDDKLKVSTTSNHVPR